MNNKNKKRFFKSNIVHVPKDPLPYALGLLIQTHYYLYGTVSGSWSYSLFAIFKKRKKIVNSQVIFSVLLPVNVHLSSKQWCKFIYGSNMVNKKIQKKQILEKSVGSGYDSIIQSYRVRMRGSGSAQKITDPEHFFFFFFFFLTRSFFY